MNLLKAVVLIGLPAGAAACGDALTTPSEDTTVLTQVVPAGGESGVDPTGPVVLTFSHPMRAGMEEYAAVHEGDVTGPPVPGVWDWSPDRMHLSFVPDEPFAPHARYTIHVGGGMRDAEDHPVDCEPGEGFGGRWVTEDMMDDGAHGGIGMGTGGPGGVHGGMLPDSTRQRMMGPGWEDPARHAFGMAFTFTTA